MSTPLNRIFKLYTPPEKLREAVDKLDIVSMSGDRSSRSIVINVDCEALPPDDILKAIESGIKELYGLESFKIQPHCVAKCLDDEAFDALFSRFKSEYPSSNGFLTNSKRTLDLENKSLKIELAGGMDFLMHLKADKWLEEQIKSIYGVQLRVTFISNENDAPGFDKEALLAKIAPAPVSSPASSSAPAPAQPVIDKDAPIFGKIGRDAPVEMKDLNLDLGYVCVTGKVFSVAHKDIVTKERPGVPSKPLTIISFDMTDYTGSIHVTRSMDVSKSEPVKAAITEGAVVTVQGKLQYNNFEKEMVLSPTCIMNAKLPERKDLSDEKRVELHLHTTMSAMDAVSSVGDLVKQAAKWGHKAIAVTDHGVVQAFPDAMKASQKHGIKIIYGCEAYYVNDTDGAVTGSGSWGIDDEIVVFDIETTGLKPANDKILEIGAVKIKNGEITEHFDELVNPHRLIPENIIALTGISDEMVADKPDIEEVLPRFLDFVGKSPLVAHNANFDVGFISYLCDELGYEHDFTYIDTLTLARAFLPEQSHHKLDNVAQALGIGDFNHHRAGDDTEVTAKIMLNFIQRLKNMGVSDVSGINLAMKGLTDSGSGSHYYHLIILVKNYVGLKNLYQLVSDAHLNHFKKRPIILRSVLDKFREGLILGSACEAGELFRAVAAHKSWNELKRIAEYYDYLEIQPIGNNMFMLREGTAKDVEELRAFNSTIVRLGQSLNKPVAATGDVHFLEPRDEVFRRILMAGQGFSDADNQPPLYFRTTDDMLREFDYLGSAKAREVVIDVPNQIADMCEEIRPVPVGSFPPTIEGSAEDLQRICYTKAYEIYGNPLPQEIKDRIEAEIQPIIKNGYDVMYMSAQKLIQKSNEAGYLVGSRGSVGSSVVAYFCGISEVNPLPPHYICDTCKSLEFDTSEKYGCGADMPNRDCPNCHKPYRKDGFNIPFFTFLGFKAEKEPDIDLNFAGEYQTQAHRDCVELFGETQVFKAGTIGSVADKTAYGYVRKYAEERGLELSKAEINRLTVGCTGIKRTTGQHPGGLIVVPSGHTIYEFCPIQHPADDPNSTIITTHFEYHAMQENLLKLDMLGHDNPTIIKHLEDMTGVNSTTIPLDDPHTIGIFTDIHHLTDVNGVPLEPDELLGVTGAAAVPEFGTQFARKMLIETKPHNFDALVRISGLSHGTDVWIGNAADLIREGTATINEVISARDDITMYLIAKGMEPSLSFKTSEAIRKGKGIIPETIELMQQHGVPQWYIDSCLKIKYLYPRAHAAAYVTMAFRIAWYKVHYPLPFYSAYFSIRAVGFDANTMTHGIEEVKNLYNELNTKPDATANEKDTVVTLEIVYEFYKRGFSFQPVDIYRSSADTFLIEGNTLIPPFTSMPGLGLSAALDLVEGRKAGEFSSEEDLKLRCPKVSKSIIDMLRTYGALDVLPRSDQISMFD